MFLKLNSYFRYLFFLAIAGLLFLANCDKIKNPINSLTDEHVWPYSPPQAQHLNSSKLEQMIQEIKSGSYGSINSMLIIRNGYLVLERYFRGEERNSPHPIYSVTKSITSALIGVALDQQKISTLQERVLKFFPEYKNIKNLSIAKQQITLKDILTMSAGFTWNEWGTAYEDPHNPINLILQSDDWIKYILDLPMSYTPGTHFTYNSGCTMLLSGIIKNKTGFSAENFAIENLFRPLSISLFEWDNGPQDITNTGWGLKMRAYDMAKIGYLYLQNGKWDERQLISESWVKSSTTKSMDIQGKYSYGYHWWLLPINNLDGHIPESDDIFFAWGHRDQFIFIIPVLNMVVVSTAWNENGNPNAIDLVYDFIIPSVTEY
jgi:CubicO group peptidase (beta-lactamase class C family)